VIVTELGASEAYVYAMGEESWLGHVMATSYDVDAVQLKQVGEFLACLVRRPWRRRGTPARAARVAVVRRPAPTSRPRTPVTVCDQPQVRGMRQKRATARFAASRYDGHFSDEDDRSVPGPPQMSSCVPRSQWFLPSSCRPRAGRRCMSANVAKALASRCIERDAESVM
jgi:hypothetical protein